MTAMHTSTNPYDGVDMHRRMVGDETRTRAFHDSIRAIVKEGMVVLDVGAGSGILSLFAAQAGASRVYGIERAPGAASLARRLVADNGFSSFVQIIEASAETAVVPERVDVIVSEWLGVFGVDENMLAPVLIARDRWLKPNGSLIPSSATAWIAPVWHAAGEEAIAFRTRPYGLNLSAMAPFSHNQAIWLPHGVVEDDLSAEPQKLWVTDCATMPAAEASTPYAAELTFKLKRDGVNGVVTWFSCDMPGGITLCNGPGHPLTHWGQFLFPISNGRNCAAGSEIKIGFHNVPAGRFGSHHIWASRVEGEPFEVHDTRRYARANLEPPWRIFQAS